MKSLSALDWVALVLVIIGGLNWGLVGVWDYDLVKSIFGDMTFMTRLVYDLVGLSAIWLLVISGQLSRGE